MLASHIFNLCKSSQENALISSKCLLFIVKMPKGFLTATIDLDQRPSIAIWRVYDANVLREDYLTMDEGLF